MHQQPAARAPGAEQKQVAESGSFAWSYIRTPPLPSLALSPLYPPLPSRFPSKSGAVLPSMLAPFCELLPLQTNKQQAECSLSKRPLLSVALFLFARVIRLPCKRTNNKQSSAFQSPCSFPLPCSYSFRAVTPAKDDRLAPLLHLRSQWCPFSLCCSAVVDNLLSSTHGFTEGRDRSAAAPRRPETPHTSLGIGLSWACTRAPRASCTGRGASETAPTPHVCRLYRRSSLLSDLRSSRRGKQYKVSLLSRARGCARAAAPDAPLGFNWRLRGAGGCVV
jgi:hypothetical protein